MKVRVFFVGSAISLFLAACGTQPAKIKETQSGMAEGRFVNAQLEDVRGKLIGKCAEHGRQIRHVSDNQVSCSKVLEGAEATAVHLLIGNAYSTPPESVAQFTLYQSGADVNVLGMLWIETQMAAGQLKKVPLEGNHQINTIQQALFDLGAK